MKRNKLTLTAGILLVISTALCFIAIGYYGIALKDLLAIYNETSELLTDVVVLGFMLSYVGSIVIKVAEIVAFLILGIKLIIKGNKGYFASQNKGLVITTMVIAYFGALMEIGSYHTCAIVIFGLFLTAGILLSCAIAKKPMNIENSVDNKVETSSNVVSETIVENGINNSQSESISNEMIEKVKLAKSLRDDHMITDEEYFNIVKKLIGIDTTEKTKKTVTRKTKEDKDESK